MPLDWHFFGDINEVHVAVSFWIPRDDPLEYNCAMPHTTSQSLDRTIKSGNPQEERIFADSHQLNFAANHQCKWMLKDKKWSCSCCGTQSRRETLN